ncbi:MAG: DUF2934 domain-containing protein [Planctomycetota bacterium]
MSATSTITLNSTGKAHAPARQPRNSGERARLDVTPEQIRIRAYEVYRARCTSGSPGDAVSDWAQAEREMRRRASNSIEMEGRATARGEKLLAAGD